MKYVSGLKWEDLTAKLGMTIVVIALLRLFAAYQRAVKQQRLRLELEQAAKENSAYIEHVKEARIREKIRERKRLKAEARGEGAEAAGAAPAPAAESAGPVKRSFRQRAAVSDEGSARITEEKAKRLLGKRKADREED